MAQQLKVIGFFASASGKWKYVIDCQISTASALLALMVVAFQNHFS